MATIKALIPGLILTLVLSGILYSAGTRGGVLALQQTTLVDNSITWSWPIFIVTFGLARALIWMMEV